MVHWLFFTGCSTGHCHHSSGITKWRVSFFFQAEKWNADGNEKNNFGEPWKMPPASRQLPISFPIWKPPQQQHQQQPKSINQKRNEATKQTTERQPVPADSFQSTDKKKKNRFFCFFLFLSFPFVTREMWKQLMMFGDSFFLNV